MYSLLALNPVLKNVVYLFTDIFLTKNAAPIVLLALSILTAWGVIQAIRAAFSEFNFEKFFAVLSGIGIPLFYSAHWEQQIPLEEAIWYAIVPVVAVYAFVGVIILLHYIGFFRAVLCILKFIFYFIVFAFLGGIGGTILVWMLANFFDCILEEQVVVAWSALIVGGIAAFSSFSDD